MRWSLLADVGAASEAAAGLAAEHRHTPIMGQTLLQPAVATAFGLKAAGGMVALDEARAGLCELPLAVQMGGPVSHRDPRVADEVAARLGLAVPLLAWHTDRVRPARVATALGILAGVLAKVARDVTLCRGLQEGVPGRGASSAMAHKRNPVAAVSVLGCALRTPGLVATLLSCMEQEHGRAAGAWQAEWGTITDLLRLTGSAAAWARDLLEHLEVDASVMRAGAGEDPDRRTRSAITLVAANTSWPCTSGPLAPTASRLRRSAKCSSTPLSTRASAPPTPHSRSPSRS